MYLKKLEIYGFKSFANKTTLVFEPGVTAVVGPNGCGKSNISDSIKWVLGEQSAKELRGLKMEDVIFNGTDTAQPVNLAEVSLTFSNKDRMFPIDYDEIIITRRVYRSGESEYLLNKTQVRLKDINALLAGTGIGVSSYSIAEQGKMDRILHSRPEDRREIFEEASGITKYKSKKKEALSKLEGTENNLIRIADIINEIRRQINSIERQAQKAERFRMEFDNMKGLDVKLSYYEYSRIREQESEKRQNIALLKQKEAQLSLELAACQDELRLYRDKINTLDDGISEKRQVVSVTLAGMDKNENSIKVNSERIDELKQRCESLSRELEEASRRLADLDKKISSLESEFNLVQGERDKRLALIKETEDNLARIVDTVKICESAIAEAKMAIMVNASGQSKLRNELSRISVSFSTALSRRRRLNTEEEKVLKDSGDLHSSLKLAEDCYIRQRRSLDSALQSLHCLKNANTQLTINVKEKASLIDKLKQRLASSGSKLEMLKDLKHRREGLSDGVKAYMEFIEAEPFRKAQFIGIVADVIQAKESFIRPLESALGEMSQAIIVKDASARQDAVRFLKESKNGRAHFIVLDDFAVEETGLPQQAPDTVRVPVLGRLCDMIEVRQDCKKVIDYLLKDVYAVDRLEPDACAAGCPVGIVSFDGDMKKGMVFSGGHNLTDECTSIIGRDGKIRELETDVGRLRSQIAECEQEYSQMLFRLDQIKKDISGQEDTAKQEEIKLHSIDAQRVKISEQADKLQEELKVIRLESEETVEEENTLKAREEVLNAQCVELEGKQREIEDLINSKQGQIAEKTAEKESAIALLSQLRTQMSLVSEKYESQNVTLNMLKSAFANENTAVSERQAQLSAALSRSGELKADIEYLAKSNGELRLRLDEGNRGLSKLQEERNNIYVLVDQFENKSREAQKGLDEIRSSVSNCHLNASELSYTSNSVKERIFSSYKIDLDNENILFTGTEDFEQMAGELKALKEKIEKMGPVNMVAIDEHNELKQRFEFLSAQQKDLIDAKESLHKAINKINRTTRKMFIETFEAIRAAFKEYFKLLFGGGMAELFLMDQADILESGIEIAVRPPGKKLQSISLLSGGEKALTSVALLFALFKVRPTPFCVLDEIDAPLDEANIDRFSRMLAEFVHSTQFIVITHNKKTISVSDVMYGITMEKSGISRIVSVKLADDRQIEERRQRAENEGVRIFKQSRMQQTAEEDMDLAEPVAEVKP
ncbi:MAG: chromosome segregation protein SMC [Candidatus Omnitrophota bacterium]